MFYASEVLSFDKVWKNIYWNISFVKSETLWKILNLYRKWQIPAPFFSSRETSSALLPLGSRVLSVLMFCHQPRMTLTSSLTHSALTRTGALIKRHRLYFWVFRCVDLPELIPHTNLARNKMFVLAEQSVLL